MQGVVEGSLTVGDAVLFITVVNQLYVPLSVFGSYYRQVREVVSLRARPPGACLHAGYVH